MERLDQYLMVRMKDGGVHNNLSTMEEEIETEFLNNQLRAQMDSENIYDRNNYFSIDQPRTKQAEGFVKELQSKRNEKKDNISFT